MVSPLYSAHLCSAVAEKHLLTKVQKEGKKAPKERVRSRSQGRSHADDKKWYKKF